MENARSSISKIFSLEPRSYTRFNLAPNSEVDPSHVEMKSSDVEDLGDVLEERCDRTTAYHHRSRRSYRRLFFLPVLTLLIFIVGYLLGYFTSHRPALVSPTCDDTRGNDGPAAQPAYVEQEKELAWGDIRNLLAQKLSASSFDDRFREFSRSSHEAGSEDDEDLGSKVFDQFKGLGLNPWTDKHYVKVQIPSSATPNVVRFGEELIGEPKGYLAYSAVGNRKGRVVYVNYGLEEDYRLLMEINTINLTGSVVIVRAGKISFAEKVANAAKAHAVAVLIYPDPADLDCADTTELYGHVHLGSGDPYTPGFPSFNHTQFPPAQSSGLLDVLAQTITPGMASKLFQKMSGPPAPRSWPEGRLNGVITYNLGSDQDEVTVVVNNVLVERKINNVFGVIEGLVDADRYVVVGAQRDSWGPGFVRATVGTSLLMELAKAIKDMVKNDRFKPRRSIVFASWSAGEYGSVGATEWLEGYLSSLSSKAFSYVSLDGVVAGADTFRAAASPLLYNLLQSTLKEVKMPAGPDSVSKTLYDRFALTDWEKEILEPMVMDDTAYPFLAFSGIPSVSFRFASKKDLGSYRYFGTLLDTQGQLSSSMTWPAADVAVTAAQVAGHMVLRLVHDHLLRLDVEKYKAVVRSHMWHIVRRVSQETGASGFLPSSLTSRWLTSAVGSYSRAASGLIADIENSDLSDAKMCRSVNDRIMTVERDFLSPYVSPKEAPFRHIIFGSGSHTALALRDHLDALKQRASDSDVDLFRNQFALITWTIQGCANNLAGDIWEMDNQI